MPMWPGSTVALAISQSIADEASAMSPAPATSTVPPENQKPRAVYDRTT
jgi:hypothetical protein